MDWTFEAKVGLVIAFVFIFALLRLVWSLGVSRND